MRSGLPTYRTILLVDDSQSWLNFLATSIAELKDASELRVLACPSGEQALAILVQHKVDLVVTDTNMPPGMDGIELLKQIRRLYPSLPVIVQFSGLLGSNISEAQIHSLGADEVLTKGSFYDRLGELLAKYLG